MIYNQHNGWTDINPHSLYKKPSILMKDAEMDNYLRERPDEYDIFGRERWVHYVDASGNKFLLALTFFEKPSGSGSLTLGAVGASATEGEMIEEDGSQSEGGDGNLDIAGQFLGEYYDIDVDSLVQGGIETTNPFLVTTFSEGDGLWLIRRGATEGKNANAGPTAAENKAIAGAGGMYDIGGAGDTFSSTTLLGWWRAVVASTAVGRLDLHMPQRFNVQT